MRSSPLPLAMVGLRLDRRRASVDALAEDKRSTRRAVFGGRFVDLAPGVRAAVLPCSATGSTR